MPWSPQAGRATAESLDMTATKPDPVHPALQALLSRPATLPAVPQVVQALIQSFSRDDVGLNVIAEQLAADPVLSVKTLRLANSAYFHVSRHIETIDDALRMLGLVMVRNLVLSVGLGHAFRNVKGIDLPLFWRHSLYCAGGARWLAGHTECNADQAHTLGLIQGLGHLVMRAADARQLQALDRHCPPLHAQRAQSELELLGFHHGQAAAELARRWQFPPAMVQALAAVHDPAAADADALVAVVRTAVWNARRECALVDPKAPEALPAAPDGLRCEWAGDAAPLQVTDAGGQVHDMPAGPELTGGMDPALLVA